MDEAKATAYTSVEGALLDDADDDVTSTDEGLAVKGVLFAFVDGDSLVVDLPKSRAEELIGRDVAAAHSGDQEAKGAWVAVSDSEDWIEMATEAHQFVGEPAVGRES